MKAAKWIKEIEEAKKKLQEYRCEDPYYCYMPLNFMESIMAKLMKSIPISWIEAYIENYDGFYGDEVKATIKRMLEEWREESGTY